MLPNRHHRPDPNLAQTHRPSFQNQDAENHFARTFAQFTYSSTAIQLQTMEIDNISDGLQDLCLDPEWLLFCPTGDKNWLLEKFDNIPRYLFRVYTPISRGMTDRFWTKSMDARHGKANRNLDIFARDDEKVARMLNEHLRWMEGFDDNLTSWTSSLLFAIVYIFSLHANSRDSSTFDNIFLCIVDTTGFPKGVFLRDIDLISAYRSFNTGLQSLENLRSMKHRQYSGSYYFGEYLSQGALKIEDKCQIVSAQEIIDEGLYNLQPRFNEFAKWEIREKPRWAEPVIELRQLFYQEATKQQGIRMEEQEAAINIAQLFDRRWRLPVAANLIALVPRRRRDSGILLTFRTASFRGSLPFPATWPVLTNIEDERENCSPSRTKMVAYSTLPEVQQYIDIMHDVYKDLCLANMKGQPRMIRNLLLPIKN